MGQYPAHWNGFFKNYVQAHMLSKLGHRSNDIEKRVKWIVKEKIQTKLGWAKLWDKLRQVMSFVTKVKHPPIF